LKKAVGYISTYKSDKIDRTIDLKNQTEKIEKFCQENGFKLIKIYEEKNINSDCRPALMKLINDAAGKNFEKVVIQKSSRIAQDNIAKTWITYELKKYKIDIVSISEPNLNIEIRKIQGIDENKAKSITRSIRNIPSLPEIVTKIMELVQNPNSSASQLSKVISHDTGLTSRVLRLVNSAYYGFPGKISSIQHAVMVLGFTTMRGLVLSSSIFKVFSNNENNPIHLDYKKLWKHSLICAVAAKKINENFHFKQDDDIFSAAILHDIGKIILDQYDHENYVRVMKDKNSPVYQKSYELEQKYCEMTHQEIGYLVAQEWNLPESLVKVIHYHHNPIESVDYAILTGIVYLADNIAHILIDFEDFQPELFDPKVLESMGINEDDLREICTEVVIEMENIGDLESFLR